MISDMNKTSDVTKVFSIAITFGLIAIILLFKLVAPAFIGMLIYLLTQHLSVALNKRLSARKAKIVAGVIMIIGIISAITLLILFLSQALGSKENLSGLSNKIVEIISDLREKMPPALVNYIPENVLEFKTSLTNFLTKHGQELGKVGSESILTLARALIAVAIAVMLSVQLFLPKNQAKPLIFNLRCRFELLSKSFENVVFAQAKISAINTLLTVIFLFIILPLAGVHLPYSKTLVLITFIAGLLPVIGNLISNTMIVLVALGLSFNVAIAALVFLIFIHKLEYFINARIIGNRIDARAWELLLAMLLMEAIFGMGGLLLAPIIYAYLKSELKQVNLI